MGTRKDPFSGPREGKAVLEALPLLDAPHRDDVLNAQI